MYITFFNCDNTQWPMAIKTSYQHSMNRKTLYFVPKNWKYRIVFGKNVTCRWNICLVHHQLSDGYINKKQRLASKNTTPENRRQKRLVTLSGPVKWPHFSIHLQTISRAGWPVRFHVRILSRFKIILSISPSETIMKLLCVSPILHRIKSGSNFMTDCTFRSSFAEYECLMVL